MHPSSERHLRLYLDAVRGVFILPTVAPGVLQLDAAIPVEPILQTGYEVGLLLVIMGIVFPISFNIMDITVNQYQVAGIT